MDLQEHIFHVEQKWLADLSRHCKKLFAGVFLPSHDHLHHHRVWRFARDILLAFDDTGKDVPPELAEQLIIACFFHDTGLTITHDERHGAQSAVLLKEFGTLRFGTLESQTLRFQTILRAVEHHDEKSYTESIGSTQEGMPELLDILSAADDLDALGAIGVYRYAEMYLFRKISVVDLPGRVLSNLEARMIKLNYVFKDLPDFMKGHMVRHAMIRDFYERLKGDILTGGRGQSWEWQLIDLISFSMENKINLMNPDIKMADLSPGLRSFMEQLHSETGR